MKKISVILSFILLLATTGFSYASDRGDLQRGFERTSTSTPTAQHKDFKTIQVRSDSEKISDLKKRADFEIQRRIDALNRLINRLSDMKKLSPDTAASLKAQVQTTIDSLNTLKTKIDADTDLTILQADVKSIITGYYIFAFYLEDINLNATLGRVSTTIDNMTTVSTKLQTRIQEAQSKNHDVTELNSWLADMQAKLTDAKTQVQSAQSEITSLTSQGFPGNKSTLLDARTKLKAAYLDLKTAYSDAKQIIQKLRSFGDNEPSVSPSPTEEITPSPTP